LDPLGEGFWPEAGGLGGPLLDPVFDGYEAG